VFLESLRRADSGRRFLYDGEGPWPQPNPAHPEGEAPVVVHVPTDEALDWGLHIGLRYFASMFWQTPASAWQAFRNNPQAAPDDAEFAKLLASATYSKFFVALDGGPDEQSFGEIVGKNAGKNLKKIDFTALDLVKPYDGMFVAGTMTLVDDHGDGTCEVLAIGLGDLVLEPTKAHRAAFDLAKLFVLQGAAYAMLFTEHPNLHFPFDSINAVTKTILPTDHVVFRALRPHLRFQLPLNNAVLLSPNSVITNFKPTFYAPFTANMRDGLLELFVAGYRGVPDHSGYPRFSFAEAPKLVDSPYGRFGRAYFEQAFLPFGKAIADAVLVTQGKSSRDDADYMQSWARFLGPMVPGFPTCEEILEEGVLARALATILYTLSVGHALDHKCFSDSVSVEQKYLRIRLAPPGSVDAGPAPIGKATTWMDRFRARLAHKIFFEPHVITKLVDVDYGFVEPPMSKAVNRFKQDLREVDRQWKGPSFLPLEQIPASIQY
jgi:hypothetical protein